MTQAAIFLCDETGNMARPWADAGVVCYCIDTEHSIRRPRNDGNINYVWGDVRSWRPPAGLDIIFVGAFPPCTHVAVSGARDYPIKGGVMLRDALETFEAARMAAAWSGAPYCVENPIGVLSSVPHIGKPDFYFDPCDFAGYLPKADRASEAYTKKTCLWTGGGFRMPKARPVEPVDGSKMWRMTPGPDRAALRSVTPNGFARAVFLANKPKGLKAAPHG